tara:strand:- start:799 stop:1128 length:330 start_codon:yes stop_codon:yes gene_type:complete
MNKPLVLLSYCIDQVGFFKAVAEKKGFETLILKKDDEIPGVIEKHSPSFILGITCPSKVKSVGRYLDSIEQDYEAVTLNRSNCFKNDGEKSIMDMKKYFSALERLGARK